MNVEVYVDGSFSVSESDVTYGGMVVLLEGKPFLAVRYSTKSPDMVKMRNIGGELVAAMGGMMAVASLAKSLEQSGVPNVTVYYDYIGIREFVKDVAPWRANSEGVQRYVAAVHYIKKEFPDIRLNFVKVKAHSGNRWNEIADMIAKGAYVQEVQDVLKHMEL